MYLYAHSGKVFLGNTLHSYSASFHSGVVVGIGELTLGVTIRWTSTPSWGKRVENNTSSCFLAKKTGISSGLMGH